MYCPAHFEETRLPVLHDLVHQHPLATLVTQGANGLSAEHVPLLLRPGTGGQDLLVGHVARGNPLAQAHLAEVLVVFQGPQCYVSPNWYASKPDSGQVVPTWNYAVVHAKGTLRTLDDAGWKRTLLNELTQTHEQAQPHPWAVDDAPEPYIERLLGAIVGIEIQVHALNGKWKVSQNQPAANRVTVVAGLQGAGGAQQQAMAELVQAFGQAPAR